MLCEAEGQLETVAPGRSFVEIVYERFKVSSNMNEGIKATHQVCFDEGITLESESQFDIIFMILLLPPGG